MPSRYISHRRIADGPSPVNSEGLQAGTARCSTILTGRSTGSPIHTLLSTTGSRPMTKPAKSSRPGTLPCVRAISDAWALPPAAALVAAVPLEAQLPLLALPLQVVVLHLALLPLVVAVAVEELLLLHRSFSAATVGS